jgi:hypothetical protein
VPTVPRIQRQVGPTLLPNARRSAHLTPLAAGVGLAQAQGQVGEALQGAGIQVGIATARLAAAQAEAAEKARQEANRSFAMRLKNKADEWRRNNVYGPTGYLSIVGENALLMPEKAQQDLKKFESEIAPTLSTPEQHLAWEGINADLQDSTMLAVYRHTGTEQNKVMVAEYTAQMTNSRSLAMLAANDPAQMVKEMRNGFIAIDQLAKLEGWLPDTTKAAKFKFGSDVNVGAIYNLIAAGEHDKARSLFAAAEKQKAIAGEDIAKVADAVKKGTDEEEAYKVFDRLNKSGMTPAQQRIEAEKEKPGVRAIVDSLILREMSSDEATKTFEKKQRDHRITQLLLKNPSFNAIPIADRQTFESDDVTHWNSVIANINASRATGGTPSPYAKVSDPVQLQRLYTLAALPDKTAFMKINFAAPNYVAALTKEDNEQFMKLQATYLTEQAEKARTIAAGPFSFNQVLDGWLAQAQIDKKDPRMADIMADIAQDGKMAMSMKKTDDPLTPAEWDPIVKGILIRHTLVKGDLSTLWIPKWRWGYEIEFDDIPRKDVEQIISAIKGMPSQKPIDNPRTDPRIISMYRQLLLERGQAEP